MEYKVQSQCEMISALGHGELNKQEIPKPFVFFQPVAAARDFEHTILIVKMAFLF